MWYKPEGEVIAKLGRHDVLRRQSSSNETLVVLQEYRQFTANETHLQSYPIKNFHLKVFMSTIVTNQ